MQTTELAVVSQWLVTRVNDRAIELHPLVNVVDDVISSLADLEPQRRRIWRQIKIESEWMSLADASRPGVDLSCREKTKQRSEHYRRELCLATHQVVLVTAKSGAGVMVDIVFDEGNAIGSMELL